MTTTRHPAVQTRRDRRRGCGFRRPGLYLVCDTVSARPCGRLPIPLTVCPTCHGGIHFSRSWTWINGTALAAEAACKAAPECPACPLGGPPGRVGLLWVGERYYPTPEDWTREALAQGVSRRIPAVPRDFKAGRTWVWVAHRKAVAHPDGTFGPGVFHAFLPTAVEYVTRGDEPPEEIDALVERGITPVEVERADEPADEAP